MVDRLTSILSRLFSGASFFLLLVSISDKILNLFGRSWSWVRCDAGETLRVGDHAHGFCSRPAFKADQGEH
jgi:hypothetical protein